MISSDFMVMLPLKFLGLLRAFLMAASALGSTGTCQNFVAALWGRHRTWRWCCWKFGADVGDDLMLQVEPTVMVLVLEGVWSFGCGSRR